MWGFLEGAKTMVVLAGKLAMMKKPTAWVTDVDFKELSRDGATYLTKITVDNPYPISIPIFEVGYSLKSATRVIASGKMADPGSLTAYDKTVVEVLLKVPHDILLSLVKDIGADGDIDYELNVDFIVDIPIFGNITLPLSAKGQIKLPSLSGLSNLFF